MAKSFFNSSIISTHSFGSPGPLDSMMPSGSSARTICGERIIVAEGKENIDFSNIIALNESAAYLWEKAADNEFTAEDMTKWLTEEYDIDDETARHDANSLATQWIEAGIVNP